MRLKHQALAQPRLPAIVRPLKANPRRGLVAVDPAHAFHQQFPVGSTLTTQAFDQWAWQHNLLPVVPTGTTTGSEAWLAHLQRRHTLKANINKAAAHPRMTDAGIDPFAIRAAHNGVWSVQSVTDVIRQNRVLQHVLTYAETKKKHVRHAMESIDLTAMSEMNKIEVEFAYDQIEVLTLKLKHDVMLYERQVTMLGDRIKTLCDKHQALPPAEDRS